MSDVRFCLVIVGNFAHTREGVFSYHQKPDCFKGNYNLKSKPKSTARLELGMRFSKKFWIIINMPRDTLTLALLAVSLVIIYDITFIAKMRLLVQ